MSDKPILFNAESIRAILAGRKTQTRRIIKQISPEWELHDMDKIYTGTFNRDEPWPWRMTNPKKQYDGRLGVFVQFQTHVDDHATSFYPCPFGAPGDTLWAKEGYQITDSSVLYGAARGRYLADSVPFQVRLTEGEISKFRARKFPYRATPGRFMYKSLARIRTPVVSIRVERVQDISDQDAMAEGVYEWYKRTQYDPNAWSYWSPVDGSGAAQKFSELWDSIHGAGAWERNDWTWVVEFEEGEK